VGDLQLNKLPAFDWESFRLRYYSSRGVVSLAASGVWFVGSCGVLDSACNVSATTCRCIATKCNPMHPTAVHRGQLQQAVGFLTLCQHTSMCDPRPLTST
jgi:hypothetical protein